MNLELIYKKICERGQIRIFDKSTYTEKHHIIPRCMNGDNSKSNLTNLTAKEHFICHKILCQLFPKEEKLRYAFWAMCNQKVNRDYIVSSRDYEYAKILCLEMWKRPKSKESVNKSAAKRRGRKVDYNLNPNRIQDGELNHNYGRKWISNKSTNQSKMINGTDVIPEGWVSGRIKIGSLGKSNSTGRKWYHNSTTGEEKYFKKDEVIPEGWINGRSKSLNIGGDNLTGKVCFFNVSLNKEKYFKKDEVIPEGWIKGKLKKKVWFYNPDLSVEKLYTEGNQDEGFFRGRLLKLPFSENIENINESVRIFKSDTKEELLVWHRDHEDRIIESISETDWMIQLDNELPKVINEKIFIPMGVYHRVIKGSGDLKIKLIKL
jgi:hypothetical protein